MREALDPSTLKKGDKLYVEPAAFPQCSKYLFEIKSFLKDRKTSTSNNDIYISMVAIERPSGEKILKTRKKDTEELGLPTECYSSTSKFYAQVLLS